MSPHTALHILQDSGAPEGSTDYTTLVLIHGYAWQSGIFAKLLPLAHEKNTRVVLVNRRDYPGAVPYTAEERAALEEADARVRVGSESDLTVAREAYVAFFDAQGREVYDLLVEFVREHDIPAASPSPENMGGIILIGWSYASAWMNAFLGNVASFPVHDVDLSRYVRRVICHDAPYEMLGYAPPDADAYTPLFDPSIPSAEMLNVFSRWVSGHFQHGPPHADGASDAAVCDPAYFSRRTPLSHPPPTIAKLTPAELAETTWPGPGEQDGGSDYFLLGAFPAGAYAVVRARALAGTPVRARLYKREQGGPEREPESEAEEYAGHTGDRWSKVELRMVWCDQSIWSMPWAVACMRKELEEARAAGRTMRRVSFVRMRGANHFVHWEEPERAMDAFLAATGDGTRA